MAPYLDCHCQISAWAAAYLAETGKQVAPFYELQATGGFRGADPRGQAFAVARLAAAASALRDLVVDSWRASAAARVGWPAVAVGDVEAGRIDPYDSLYGAD
jgi:hypothetical protein